MFSYNLQRTVILLLAVDQIFKIPFLGPFDRQAVVGFTFSNMYPSFDIPPTGESLSQSLSQALTLSTLWKFLFVILLLGNLKNLPLVWHVSSSPLDRVGWSDSMY